MKKIIFLCLVIISLSCNTNRQVSGGSQIGLRNLTHYYLKNSIALNSSYNGIVVFNANDFTDLFYSEMENDESIATPDFKGQIVVALALNTTDNSRIVFTKAETSRNEINVYGKKETVTEETQSPVAVATLPKYSDARQINFYVDGSLVKTVSVSFKNNNNIFADVKTNSNRKATQKPARRKPAVI